MSRVQRYILDLNDEIRPTFFTPDSATTIVNGLNSKTTVPFNVSAGGTGSVDADYIAGQALTYNPYLKRIVSASLATELTDLDSLFAGKVDGKYQISWGNVLGKPDFTILSSILNIEFVAPTLPLLNLPVPGGVLRNDPAITAVGPVNGFAISTGGTWKRCNPATAGVAIASSRVVVAALFSLFGTTVNNNVLADILGRAVGGTVQYRIGQVVGKDTIGAFGSGTCILPTSYDGQFECATTAYWHGSIRIDMIGYIYRNV